MPARSLWKISLRTTPVAEDAVSEALQEVFGVSPAGYTDAETRETTVSVYLETKPPPGSLRALRGRMQAVRAAGLTVGSGRVERLRRENWAESWKRHFKPLPIGGALLVKPSWSRRRERAGQKVLILDPGLSFGTGHHATTSFCLREVVRQAKRGGAMLDIGSGSGILAIAAAKLGLAPVAGYDFDPEAVRVARANARRNGVARRLTLRQADLTREPARPTRTYDLVCANLIANLLLAERRRIARRVAPGGTLVLAGILTEEFETVRRAFAKCGLRLARQRTEREWTSGAFVHAARRRQAAVAAARNA